MLRLDPLPPPPAFRPFDKLRDRRLKDLPRFPPKFVEPVETNPEIISAFALHPRPFDHEDPLVCNSPIKSKTLSLRERARERVPP